MDNDQKTLLDKVLRGLSPPKGFAGLYRHIEDNTPIKKRDDAYIALMQALEMLEAYFVDFNQHTDQKIMTDWVNAHVEMIARLAQIDHIHALDCFDIQHFITFMEGLIDQFSKTEYIDFDLSLIHISEPTRPY